MVQVNIPSELSQFYNYDDSGRRISKAIGTLATQYLYNGNTLINEYDGLTGNSQAYYTHGVRLDEVLISETPSQTYYYHSDGLNSVVSATDASGIAQSTAQFDAWGNALAATGTAQNFGYTGREPDETGLIYYRARYYDAELGRFLQRDPIGLAGGVNRYAYVLNSPVNFTDPFGLDVLIQIGYKYAAYSNGKAEHAFVILTDTVTGNQWATRAGPERAEGNENISIGGDGILGVEGFGSVYAEQGPYDNSFKDNPANVKVLSIQDIGVIGRDFSEVVANAKEFAQITNDNGLIYNPTGIPLLNLLGPIGGNSNSYAFTFVESLTGVKPFPQGNTVLGPWLWWRGFPDSDLSYSPSPIIAGGAFTVGNIFQ